LNYPKDFLLKNAIHSLIKYGAPPRSVCTNLAQAWRKRRYRAAFLAKLSDAETEAADTQVWADIAHRSGYWPQETFRQFDGVCDKIMGQIVRMSDQPEKWLIKPRLQP